MNKATPIILGNLYPQQTNGAFMWCQNHRKNTASDRENSQILNVRCEIFFMAYTVRFFCSSLSQSK